MLSLPYHKRVLWDLQSYGIRLVRNALTKFMKFCSCIEDIKINDRTFQNHCFHLLKSIFPFKRETKLNSIITFSSWQPVLISESTENSKNDVELVLNCTIHSKPPHRTDCSYSRRDVCVVPNDSPGKNPKPVKKIVGSHKFEHNCIRAISSELSPANDHQSQSKPTMWPKWTLKHPELRQAWSTALCGSDGSC